MKKEVFCINREKHNKFALFLFIYTLLFSAMLIIILIPYIKNGYSLLRIGDSYTQHLKALTYYAEYFREVISVLINEHRIVIPQWDFEIGLGADIVTTFSYYVIGDPFNLLSIFVPQKYIYIYYQLMIIIRIYVSGLAFSYLCFFTGKKNTFSVLAGALTYCFSSYAVYAGLKHAYFVNPMIFLPLIIVGAEKIITDKSSSFFITAVAFSALSNFYFFYMLVILTIVYVTVRLFTLHRKNFKKIFFKLCCFVPASVKGVMISAVIFLPTVIAFLDDSRHLTERNVELFYSADTYKKLLLSFFTYGRASTWLAVCVSAVFFPCLILLFSEKKKNSELKILYIISLIFMSFPFFGSFLNGFSYICHRWCFGYVLLISFIITSYWEKFINSDRNKLLLITVFSLMTAALCFYFGEKRKAQLIIPFLLLFITLTVLFLSGLVRKQKFPLYIRNTVCFIFCLSSSLSHNYFLISPEYGDYLSEFFTVGQASNLTYYDNNAILQACGTDEDFFRFSGRQLSLNASFIDSLKSTQFYWSISNGNISEYRAKMNLAENIPYKYIGFDDRTALNALACVKYFYNNPSYNPSLPYGFTPVTNTVSVNTLTLPFGYTYDEYITVKDYEALGSSVAGQEIMLKAALLEKEADILTRTSEIPLTEELVSKISTKSKKIKYKNGIFTVKKAGDQAEITFDAIPCSETYISFEGFDYKGTSQNQINIVLNAEDTYGQAYEKSFLYYTEKANINTGRKNFDINLGYTEKGICRVTVTFPYKGTYSFDSIKIIAQTMSDYEKSINKLKENILEDVSFDYNSISGKIYLEKSKLLCLSMPYSKGWTAYVDGKETPILKTNGMYCGILLSEGDHTVFLSYSTPGLKEGCLISLCGIAISAVISYNYKKKKLYPSRQKTDRT